MEDGGWPGTFAFRTLRFGFLQEPGFNVLLETFLSLEVVGHNDNRAAREHFPEQDRKKRLRRLADTRASQQHSAMLQSPRQGLHSGSFRDVSEQIAGRRRCRVLRQAKGHSQRNVSPSSRASPGFMRGQASIF
jgi:hypothetical protein